MRLQVHRWSTRVVVPAARRHEPWRAWCETLLRGPMGRRLLEALLEALDLRGYDLEETVLLVRRLALRVRVRGRPAPESVAAGWAEAVVTELIRILEAAPAEAAGGAIGEAVALFPSPVAAETAALRTRGAVETPWWAARVLADRTSTDVIAGWIAEHPALAPGAILRTCHGRPADLARLVTAQAAEALVMALDTAWDGRVPWVAPAPDPTAPEVLPAHLALLLACETRAARVARSGVRPAFRSELPAPHPVPVQPLDEVPAEPAAGSGPSPIEVDLAGLLFLLRPLIRHPWLAEVPWPAWPWRLAAVWSAVREALLADVDEPVAERIIEANAPLVEAFLVVPADDPPAPSAEAGRVLADLLAELRQDPRPVPPAPDRLARHLDHPRPAPWDRLARVVLRPGRLVVSDDRVDLFLRSDSVDVALRSAGWDLDPGFVPGLRRVVRFHYEEGSR